MATKKTSISFIGARQSCGKTQIRFNHIGLMEVNLELTKEDINKRIKNRKKLL